MAGRMAENRQGAGEEEEKEDYIISLYARGGGVWGREGGSTAYLQFRRMTRTVFTLPRPLPSSVAGIIDPFFLPIALTPDERRIFGSSGPAARYLSSAARRDNLHRTPLPLDFLSNLSLRAAPFLLSG